MSRQLLQAVSLTAIASLAGCSQIGAWTASTDYQQGTLLTDEQMALFKPQASSSQDVSKVFGEPDKSTRIGNRTYWSYRYVRSPVIPFTGRQQYEQVVVFEFDKSGLLQRTRKRVLVDEEPAT